MYKFETFDLGTINIPEYEAYRDKNLFTTIKWLQYLQVWKKVNPIIVRITNIDNELVGHFTGCTFKKFGVTILGSPFYGWMGQHMGFDFVDSTHVDKSKILDDLINYLREKNVMSFMIFADFKFTVDDILKCKSKLFYSDIRGSYFLDLTQPEEILFKNFKSGYRTCVRKFEKLGGSIVEEYSDKMMDEHHQQLKEVFERKSMVSPSYRNRLNLLHQIAPEMILGIKALDENGNNIASSYYLGSGRLAFFQSNASNTKALQYNANQALMWYAIKYWKSKGMRVLDLAGRAAYKENFGSVLYNTPTIVWAKYVWQYNIIMFAKKMYYKSFRIKYSIKKLFSKS